MDHKLLKVWLDGRMLGYKEARVPILTHSMQYGSGIFEGIRANTTDRGTAVFRLPEHVKRFTNSAKIYSMRLGYSERQLSAAVLETIKRNGLDSCYVRPFAFYNDDNIGLSTKGKKVSVYIAAIPFGAYFNSGTNGLRCKVSSWRRINSEILPVEAKASGNYLNSIIANNEARMTGFDEAILVSIDGYVAEGPGENLFLVRGGRLITPSVDSDILVGITRDSVIRIAQSLGIEVEQRHVKRDELYIADELFFAGTAVGVAPIGAVDSVASGRGMGPTTRRIAEAYDAAIHGKLKGFEGWLTYV